MRKRRVVEGGAVRAVGVGADESGARHGARDGEDLLQDVGEGAEDDRLLLGVKAVRVALIADLKRDGGRHGRRRAIADVREEDTRVRRVPRAGWR